MKPQQRTPEFVAGPGTVVPVLDAVYGGLTGGNAVFRKGVYDAVLSQVAFTYEVSDYGLKACHKASMLLIVE